jgi:hypothetical protein
MAEAYEDIHVEFSLSCIAREDITVLFQSVRDYYTNVSLEFHINSWNSYNFSDMGVVFQVLQGLVYENIGMIFSVVKAPQSFMSYIFQKLYCTTTEVGAVYEDQQLLDWNVKPNQTWYVVTYGLEIYLLETLVNYETEPTIVAQGAADATTLRAILYINDEYDTTAMDFYYQDYPYHVTLSEEVAEMRIYKVKPLTDLSEIRHPIYNNSNIALSRGEAELNLHTYAKLGREIVLGTHLPELEVGDTVELTSVRRNKTEISQVLSQTISGEVSDNGESSLITSIQVANYLELTR